MGLGLVALLVAAAFALHAAAPAVSPLIAAMAAGGLAAPLAGGRAAALPGVRFAGCRLLRAGVALLGLQVALGDLVVLGGAGAALIAGTLTTTLLVTAWLGRRLGVGRDLTLLIAAGTAICGASAIAAMNSVADADEGEVGYAVATVTIFGTAAMLAVPAAGGPLLGLTPAQTGLWAGASIHEVAQVAGAAGAVSLVALKIGTLVKLGRVVLLAPVVAVAGALAPPPAPRAATRRSGVPGFVLGFLALAGIRTLGVVPPAVLGAAHVTSTALLGAGLAALGLQIDAPALRAAGLRPFALGLAASLVASGVALALVVVLYR